MYSNMTVKCYVMLGALNLTWNTQKEHNVSILYEKYKRYKKLIFSKQEDEQIHCLCVP